MILYYTSRKFSIRQRKKIKNFSKNFRKGIDKPETGCYTIYRTYGNESFQAAATASIERMKFTFEEWKFIQHCIECAGREFEKMMLDSTPSDKETSCYQIFKRQTEKANALVEKIKGSEI